ncbi:VanZ family protein [Halorussus marinus]|uniref:VanZ family protein n=1 Tax=Halorussus marinus TaxID=2505976 RepID=UPI00106E70E3|nr:VanZ family protein [Halorussus marinus]
MRFESLGPPGWVRWLGVAVVAGVLFYGSVLDAPGSGLSPLGPFGTFGLDKWLHGLGYAALAAALASALAADRSALVAALLAAAIAVAYGVGIEFVQASIPERSFSVGDMAADAVGAVLAVVCWRLAVGGLRRFESPPSEG